MSLFDSSLPVQGDELWVHPQQSKEGVAPISLPYGLQPRHFTAVVEDVEELLADVNGLLKTQHYDCLEHLLDSASFSGLISRTVAMRLQAASRSLVVNRYHNGYPDLLVKGQYPRDMARHGRGGLEIKASRYEKGWQAHAAREGWFCVVQFTSQTRDAGSSNKSGTTIEAVMVAELTKADWSWHPAKPGRIRSGTATMKASAVAKCRAGAVWVSPDYRTMHNLLLKKAHLETSLEQLTLDLEAA